MVTCYSFFLYMHPLLAIAFMLMYGLVHQFFSWPVVSLVAVVMATSLLLWHVFDFKKIGLWYFVLLVCAAPYGAARYQAMTTRYYDFAQKVQGKNIQIKAVVGDIERIKNKRHSYVVTLDVYALRMPEDDDWNTVKKTFLVYIQQKPACVVADDIVCCNLHAAAKNNQEYEHYLIKEKIAQTFFAQQLCCAVLSSPEYSVARSFWLYKKNLFSRLQRLMSPKVFSLFSSIFLGKRDRGSFYTEQNKQQFKVWGVSHYLARSGLHLVIFIMIWNFLLMVMRISIRKKIVILLFLTTLYSVLSWITVSFSRALIIFFLHHACLFFSLKSNLVHLLSLACCLTLLVNPYQLFFLDFQLSFGITFLLAVHNQMVALKKFKQ